MNLKQTRQHLDKLRSQYQYAQTRYKEEKHILKKVQQEEKDVQEALVLVQELAEKVQHDAHKAIADIVTRCLQAVFGEDTYHLNIKIRKSRGKTDALLQLVKGDLVLDDPESESGGVKDVVAFALRLAALILSRPSKRRLMILDEPFRHLNSERMEIVVELLQTLSEEMGIQFIMVTQAKSLATVGKVIHFK